jgi:hypothetical protein
MLKHVRSSSPFLPADSVAGPFWNWRTLLSVISCTFFVANGRVDPVCLRSTACSGSCSPSESPGLGILRGSAQTARVQRLCARPIGTRERSNGEPLRVTSTFSPRASNSVPMPDLERNVRVETTDIASDATRSNLSNSATLSLREPGLLAVV